MVWEEACESQQLRHRFFDGRAPGDIVLQPLQVQRTQLLVVGVGKGVVGPELLHRVYVVAVGEGLLGHDYVVAGLKDGEIC